VTAVPRIVEVRQKVLKQNDVIARQLRQRFQDAGVFVVAMIQHSLGEWPLDRLDFLFIENVGNLVCPSSYDLGENLRLVLLSVTEGEDKPLKYPTIFNSADVAMVTKMDLAEGVEFDFTTAVTNIQRVRPGMDAILK